MGAHYDQESIVSYIVFQTIYYVLHRSRVRRPFLRLRTSQMKTCSLVGVTITMMFWGTFPHGSNYTSPDQLRRHIRYEMILNLGARLMEDTI